MKVTEVIETFYFLNLLISVSAIFSLLYHA